jgi:hypothetical protein
MKKIVTTVVLAMPLPLANLIHAGHSGIILQLKHVHLRSSFAYHCVGVVMLKPVLNQL